MARYLRILLFIGVVISDVVGKCTYTITKDNGQISCSDITAEDYLTSAFEMKVNIINSMPNGYFAKMSIDIADSHLPILGDWLFLPWDDNFSPIQSIKIVNSSVNTVNHLSKLSVVKTLNLSGNNISDFTFLNKMKKLTHLYLSHSKFNSDSYLYTYLQRLQTRLNLIDLSHSNLDEFVTATNHIDKYDLSFNPNLTICKFNSAVHYKYPSLNLSGNNNLKTIQYGLTDHSFNILSLDLSNSNRGLNVELLKTIRISKRLLLNNNNIPSLNESTFKLGNIVSSRISLDISNSSLTYISSNYFSNHILDVLNLSNNNLAILEGSIFKQSDIFTLDLSNSCIASIASSVFNYLIVDTLNLSGNNISSLNGVFNDIESMKHLDLSSNPIETLKQTTFKNCRDLETLNLANVFTIFFNENPFLNIASLKTLILSFNNSIDSAFINNTYVTDLVLTNSTVSRLNAEQFKGFHKLKNLTFLQSSTSAIDKLAFKGLFSLKRINNLKEFGKYDINIFRQLYSLKYLDLSKHDLKSINLELKDLYSLKKLNLSSNALSSVDVNSFITLKQLEVLSLSDNQISSIDVGTFRELNKLTHLYLNKNQLQQLQPGLFSALQNLLLLDLSQNDLLRTKPHLLLGASVPKLIYLYLQGNGIGNEYVKGDDIARRNELTIIANHNTLEYIDINQNGWRCPTLIDVLTVFKIRNITYNPTSPDYTTNNINGITCT